MRKNEKLIAVVSAVMMMSAALFAAQSYVKAAGKVIYSNTGAAISSDDVVDLGDQYAIALVDIAASTGAGIVKTDGIFDLTLQTNETISIGDKLYYDSASTTVTETATADTFIGTAVEAKTTTTATGIVQVWLNADVRAVIVGVDVQAYSAALTTLATNDGSAITNIAAGNIASGDVASARMTANAPVSADFAADSEILVGTGAGTFVAESGATLRTSIGLGSGLTITNAAVTNFDITVVNGVITAFTAN